MGWLVVFEGIDGTGKSTQIQLLTGALKERGIPAVALREPTEGPYGRELRRMASEGRPDPQRERELFVADRREDVEHNILPALNRGDVVLLDRYYYSTMAYQGARGVSPEDIQRENESFAPCPDLLFIFQLPVEEALKRVEKSRGKRPDLFEESEYLKRVQAQFDAITHPRLIPIDARKSPEDISEEVLSHVLALIQTAPRQNGNS